MFSLGIIGPNCKLESCNVEKYQMYRVFQTYGRLQNVFDGVEYQLTQNIELLSSAIKYIVLIISYIDVRVKLLCVGQFVSVIY